MATRLKAEVLSLYSPKISYVLHLTHICFSDTCYTKTNSSSSLFLVRKPSKEGSYPKVHTYDKLKSELTHLLCILQQVFSLNMRLKRVNSYNEEVYYTATFLVILLDTMKITALLSILSELAVLRAVHLNYGIRLCSLI